MIFHNTYNQAFTYIKDAADKFKVTNLQIRNLFILNILKIC